MTSSELILGGVVVTLFYTLGILGLNYDIPVLCLCPLCSNIVLLIFYILYLKFKLPIKFYKNKAFEIDNVTKFSVTASIMYSLGAIIMYMYSIPEEYRKLATRILILTVLLTAFGLMFYGVFGRLFFSVSKSELWRCVVGYIRIVLVMFSNVIFWPIIFYSYSVSYRGDMLVRKEIVDGMDRYLTIFDYENGEYITKVSKRNNPPEMDYIIHYDIYPDKISKIDTISIRK